MKIPNFMNENKKKILFSFIFSLLFSCLIDYFVLPIMIVWANAPTLQIAISQMAHIPPFKSHFLDVKTYEFDQLYIFIVFMILFFLPFGLSFFKKERGYRMRADIGSHGVAKFATDEEIKDIFLNNQFGLVLGGYSNKKTKKIDPLIMKHDPKTPSLQNILVFGPAGTGKSASFVVPSLFTIADSGIEDCFVVTDPKGELYKLTADYMQKSGYKVRVFGFTPENDMFLKGEGYNPIMFCKNMRDVTGLSNALLTVRGANEWTDMALNLLTSIIGFLRFGFDPEYATLINAKRLIALDDDLENSTLHQMITEWYKGVISDDKSDQILRDFVSEIRDYWDVYDSNRAEGPRSSIRGTTAGALSIFGDYELGKMISKNTFKWSDFTENDEKTITYIIMKDKPTYAPLTRIFFMQFFDSVAEIADGNSKNNGRLSRHLRFILDEFGNLGRIEGIPVFMALSRGRNTSVCPIVQDLSQFDSLYGRAGSIGGESAIIQKNTTGMLVLGFSPIDRENKKLVSDMIGNTTIEVDSQSKNDKTESNSVNFTSRPLLDVSDLAKMKDDEFLLSFKGVGAILDKKFMYFKNPKWQNLNQITLDLIAKKEIDLMLIDLDYFRNLYKKDDENKENDNENDR